MYPKVSICTINYKGITDTLECLESLGHLTYPNFDVYVIENGSGEKDLVKLEQFAQGKRNFHIRSSKENLGFGGGNNYLMREILSKGNSEFIYLLNNDAYADPDFLTYAVSAALKDDNIAMVGSMLANYYKHNEVDSIGHILLDCGDTVLRGNRQLRKNFTECVETLGCSSGAVLLRVSALRDYGLYDEDFFLNFEDADICYRAILYGYTCVVEPRSVIYHKVSQSVNKVRNREFMIRSMRNGLRAYWYNMPMGVILVNLPMHALRFVAAILTNLLTLRFDILIPFLRARFAFWGEFSRTRAMRKKYMPHKKVKSSYILSKQVPFLPRHLNYFWNITLHGKKRRGEG